jgi:hypothetical protein
MKTHKDLDVWQEAVSLAENVYIISKEQNPMKAAITIHQSLLRGLTLFFAYGCRFSQ